MSIFDRLKDIVGFLNTRPESRTPEQEQIGEELSEAEKTARDIAESRLEGVTDEEASNFLDTIRDFLNSDQKNINEFRKKNADQIARDKALFKKFTRLNPVGMVKDFLLKKAIQTYGPAVQEIATKFIAGLEDPDVKTGNQFEFMGTVYTDQDYLEAGKLNKPDYGNEDSLYAIDQNRGGVSNLKAFISLLPDDYAKLPTQVYNDLRQMKKNHPNTPFADFYDSTSVKTSGLEFILLRANKQNPDVPITKTDLLGLIQEGGELDSSVRKTRYNRGEVMNELRMNRLLKNINESIEQMANYANDQYIYKYYPELQQYLFDVRDAVQLEKDKLSRNERPDDFSLEEEKTYSDALANEFKLKIRQVGEDLIKPENIPERFKVDEEGMFTYNTLIESLLRNLGNNVLTPLLPEQSSDFPTGQREPTYSNMSVTGTTNYDVHGVVGMPREAVNEKLRTDTHYRGDFVLPNYKDFFHYRTGQLMGDSGPVNYFIEVQSDHEEQIRKSNKYFDPSLALKGEELTEKNLKFANEKLPGLQNFFKLNDGEKDILDQIFSMMRYDEEREGDKFAFQDKDNPSNVYVMTPDGEYQNSAGGTINPATIDSSRYKIYRNAKDTEFIAGGSPVMKAFLDVYFGGDAIMTDNIPAANVERYLEKNTRSDELLKYVKKLNEFREDLFKGDRIRTENVEGSLSKTAPYVGGPQEYAEKAIYEFIFDSVRQGVDKVSWVPGEVSTQVQFARDSDPSGFVDHDTTLATHSDPRQSQGMFDFYGSTKQPKENHMYRAAEVVVDKIGKLGKIIYGEDFVAPVLYEQGAKDENDRLISPINPSSFQGDNRTDRADPGITEGWGFIDLKPMIDSIKGENKQEVLEQIFGNYVERKSGGQVWSSSLVSLDEVING
tara:strand:- start:105 stop:2777 length:2673 start_codon:yes stop_codon:yes gene_type:complete